MEWVSGNLLLNLLHLESDYTSEPQGSYTILLLYNTDQKCFSDYYFFNKEEEAECVDAYLFP